ncbi:siderophore-interacting protein [Paracoccus sp. (in: a-proteobacteria)]|uniref:siderophore-interacting protein n=1 Tax=Paracoccus sp. TaxID=267 RepID=UPI003A847391
MDNVPRIERLRHDTVRRNLTVAATTRLSPVMLRLTLAGPELAGFLSASPDDHVKLIVPDGAGGQAMRDYTPRRFDPVALTLEIDFAIHDAGPATIWALGAKPGDPVTIGGPRGSQVINGPVANWLLIGDETALPAIGRRIEEMPPDMPVTSLVSVPGKADEQRIDTRADHTALWVHRDDPADPVPLRKALSHVDLPSRCFVWIAAEARVARAVRDDLTQRGLGRGWMKAAGYWVAGQADSSDKNL